MMPKLHLKIQMEVAVSNQFLDQFKLEEMGHNYNFFRGSATKPDQFPDEHNGNEVLAGEIANKCFRNNSVTVYHVTATELLEEGDV